MLRRFFLPAFLLALPLCATAAACSLESRASLSGADDEAAPDEAPGMVADSSVFSPNLEPKPLSGSPLCGDVSAQCSPDEDGAKAGVCAVDGGLASEIDAGEAVQACRIVRNSTTQGAALSACAPASASLRGVDGTSCKSASDCAPGFDCVDGEAGAVCRRYCCGHTCDGYLSQNGGPTFCDVQPLVRPTPAPTADEQVKAPVCMPLKACTLLEPGGCGRKETCAVVTPKGDTGCVAIDTAQAGDACEAKHCAEGLTCLGSPGDRTCYRLCKVTDSAACGPSQKCTPGSTFKGTSYGVCRE